MAAQPTMQVSNLHVIVFMGRDRVYDVAEVCGDIVVAEASRFMGVSMHVQGPLSGAFLSISLAALNRKYFSMWSYHSDRVRSGVFTPGEQIQVEVLL